MKDLEQLTNLLKSPENIAEHFLAIPIFQLEKNNARQHSVRLSSEVRG